MVASAVIGVGMAVYSHHQSQKEEAKELLEEQTKTTDALVSTNKTNQILGNLANYMQQANIYHLRAALTAEQHKDVAEEQLVVTAEAANTSNIQVDTGFEMDKMTQSQ